jgi:hypothetical protein
MKIKGKALDAPAIVELVIHRGEEKIIFRAQAVLDQDDYDEKFPRPKAPIVKVIKTGDSFENTKDPDYVKELDKWAECRTHHMILKSLQATEGLEWETVDPDKPETFKNYADELKAAYFTPVQIMEITQLVFKANGLSQDRVDEARKSFLQRQEPQQEQ